MRHLLLLLLGIAFASSFIDAEEIISPELEVVENALKNRVSKIYEVDDDDDDDISDNDDADEPNDDDDNDDDENEPTADDDDENGDVADDNEPTTDGNDTNKADVSNNNNDDDDDDEEDQKEFDVTETESSALCSNFACEKGEECVVSLNEAKCRCATSCPAPVDDQEKVCGTNNLTYSSECEFWRSRCLYKRDGLKSSKHLRIDYFGPCIEIKPCSGIEMQEYPSRMRSWLKNIFLQFYDKDINEGGLNAQQRNNGRKLVANRAELSVFEKQSIVGSETEQTRYRPLYVYPVHWKFATLDLDPADKYLTKSELEPMLGTLIPLEHCTRDFFRAADKDKDHMISLYEWGVALGFNEEDMDFDLVV